MFLPRRAGRGRGMSNVRFSVIVADPPWQYDVSGVQGDPNVHYPTVRLGEMLNYPVAQWAADDAVLAMWGTWPKLNEAPPLMAAWGFRYVTGFPWIKTAPGTGSIRRGVGFWTQSASEFVLIGRRGEPKKAGQAAPVLGLLLGEDRQFFAPVREHSRKPYGVQDWLEEMFDGPYLELFARRERPGWTTWGLDVGFKIGPAGVESVARMKPVESQGDLFEVTR
jgi:N6-adenosine-specific RNA methylase IME4